MRLGWLVFEEGRSLSPTGPGFEEAGAKRRPTKSLAQRVAPGLNSCLQNINSPNVSPYSSSTKPSTPSIVASWTLTLPPNS
jgi:hypothetical protein